MKSHCILLIAIGAAGVPPAFATQIADAPSATLSVQAGASAVSSVSSVDFAVMRNGAQIGTNSIRFAHDGADTKVQMVTHIKVGIAFLTLYRFDQTENEQWTDGRLLRMNATTDDNGTVHRASAVARNGKIVVQCDGRISATPPSTIVPFNLWNPALVAQNVALDTRNGGLETIRVEDRGEGNVMVQGRVRRAHHYQIVATFPQDVWYDDSGQLVRVELKGSDGSTILYQMV
ncbi:MAG TPA: DUF6134 family protein [Rhizomicrobium sp.]|jgi:hypothetical protein|nr:DUF6134 family protein [Rhizomicrobium sp.]